MPVTLAALGILLYLASWLAPVLAPVGLGLFIAALAGPFHGSLERRTGSSAAALAITVGAVLVIGGSILVLGVVSARTLTQDLAMYAAEISARYAQAPGVLGTGGLADLVPPEALVAVLRTTIDVIWQVVTSLGFAVVLAALLLLDRGRLSGLVASGLGRTDPVFRELPALARTAVTYFVVRIRVNAATAAGLLALMLVLGVDDALLWAVGAFFLSFVPYLGLIIALIPPTILAFAESGPLAALAIVVGGTVLNVVAENVLEPTLTGRALHLSTWLVFAMFFLWVFVLGPLGALLSMPITVFLVLALGHDERTRWLASMLGRDPTVRS
jgi:predicted PurR-regulated permease PerM